MEAHLEISKKSIVSKLKSKKTDKEKEKEKETIINEEHIEALIKGKSLASLCIKNGKLEDEPAIIALLVKEGKSKYECSSPGCNVGMNWKKKPIKLILARKNGKPKDLRLENIELVCPNCFVQSYGVSILKEIVKPKLIVCRICGYDKVGFLGEPYRSSKYCGICFKKLQEGSNTINSQVRSEMLLYKSIEEATTGIKTELTLENENKLIDDFTELTHTNTSTDLNDIAMMLNSSSSSSSIIKPKYKPKYTPHRPNSQSNSDDTTSIKISSINEINLSSLDDVFEEISKS